MIGCAVVALQDPGVRVVLSMSFGNVTREHRAEMTWRRRRRFAG
jgi:hypothetical protein